MSHTSSKRKILMASALTALCITACDHPNAIPSGYTYHAREYKSPEPPQSVKFSKEQRATMTEQQAAQFRSAVHGLVETLTVRAGVPPKSVYILAPEKMTPFYANFDNNLRESARHLNYRLSDHPDNSYVMTYTAEVLKTPDGKPIATGAGPNVKIAVQVHDKLGEDSKMLTEEWTSVRIDGAEELSIPYLLPPGVKIPDTAPSRNNLAN